jgi:catecholate siderophore receptor
MTQPTPSLLPLRLAMGGAIGVTAVASLAVAQTAAPPADDTTVRLQPIPVEGSGGTGYQASVPALPKLTQPLLDTPQSISVIPQQVIQDQGITATREALRMVPGVSLAAGEAGAQGDNLTLRGFTARNDFFLDGMRDFGSYYRDPFNQESIEVLKGPSSILFGRGSTGGVVNQVSKQPYLGALSAGSISLGTDGTHRLTADVNREIPGVPGAAVRLNLMVDENGIAGRNEAGYRRFGIAPSIAFGLGTPTRVFINYFHMQEYDTPDYGLPWFYGAPAPVSRTTFYGFKDKDYLRANVDVITGRIEHEFNDAISFRSQVRFGNYGRDARITEPQIVYGAGVTPLTPLAALRVNRNVIAVQSTETLLDWQADMTARFTTGPFSHALVAGVEAAQESSRPLRYTVSGLPTTSLVNPNPSDPFLPTAVTVRTRSDSTSNLFAAYAVDTIKYGEHWELTGGVRFDNFDTRFTQSPGAIDLHRADALVSYRVALTFKPTRTSAIYFAHGTSFNPSGESLSLAANTADLAPEKNETFELGAKWDVLGERLSLTGAIFQIEKLNARIADPNNPGFNILGGDQEVKGFEIGATGRITDDWQIYGGYSYLESKVTKGVPASVGRPLANTPQNTFSAWTAYRLPWHDITVGGGVQYVDARFASITPNATTGVFLKAPSYVTVQAMARVPVKEGVELQVNGYNLANAKYYDLLHPAHVVPGSGRSVLFTLNVKL